MKWTNWIHELKRNNEAQENMKIAVRYFAKVVIYAGIEKTCVKHMNIFMMNINISWKRNIIHVQKRQKVDVSE